MYRFSIVVFFIRKLSYPFIHGRIINATGVGVRCLGFLLIPSTSDPQNHLKARRVENILFATSGFCGSDVKVCDSTPRPTCWHRDAFCGRPIYAWRHETSGGIPSYFTQGVGSHEPGPEADPGENTEAISGCRRKWMESSVGGRQTKRRLSRGEMTDASD